MDAVDILGGMLGRRSGGGGLGGKILKGILFGKKGQRTPETRAPEPSRTQRRDVSTSNPNTGSNRLDDLIRDAYGHHTRRRPAQQAEREPEPQYETRPRAREEYDPHPMNAEAEILIRAMVCAAKADGRVDREEQNRIIGQLGDLTRDEMQFLQNEFDQSASARDLAWSVPLGMEQQVYGISLMAIELDQNQEAQYLSELAQGLRLAPELCNQIHEQFGAPTIFQ